MNTHGAGFTVEVQIDTAKLIETQVPGLSGRFKLFIKEKSEAKELL